MLGIVRVSLILAVYPCSSILFARGPFENAAAWLANIEKEGDQRVDLPAPPSRISAEAEISKRAAATSAAVNFSMVINTYMRDSYLKILVDTYRSCHDLRIDLHVCWNEANRTVPGWLDDLERGGAVIVDRNPDASMTNRFKPRNFLSDNIFSTDDDVIYSCGVLSSALRIFLQSHPLQIVGFAPRWVNRYLPMSEWMNIYNPGDDKGIWCCFDHAWRHHRANLVLPTKGSFMKSYWLEQYFLPRYSSIRARVDANFSGEDVLMAMMHANITGLRPVPLLVRATDFWSLRAKTGLTRALEDGGRFDPMRRARVVEDIIADVGFDLQVQRVFLDAVTGEEVANTSGFRIV